MVPINDRNDLSRVAARKSPQCIPGIALTNPRSDGPCWPEIAKNTCYRVGCLTSGGQFFAVCRLWVVMSRPGPVLMTATSRISV